MTRFVAIEGGGTTFAVAISKENSTEEVAERIVIETTTPDETLERVISWLLEREKLFHAIGIACFGPLELNKSHPLYGHITTTPKTLWRNTNVFGKIRAAFPYKPIGFDTDVNAPAFAEAKIRNVKNCCYVTIGTGVGVGCVIDGRPVHGLMHPEGGHIYTPRGPADEQSGFEGTCPYHKGCIEGMMASGAISKRIGCTAAELENLSDDHEVWETIAFYGAQLCVTLSLVLSPEIIVIGGGISKRTILYPKIRRKTLELLNGYLGSTQILDRIDEYIVSPAFGSQVGVIGAFGLAKQALGDEK